MLYFTNGSKNAKHRAPVSAAILPEFKFNRESLEIPKGEMLKCKILRYFCRIYQGNRRLYREISRDFSGRAQLTLDLEFSNATEGSVKSKFHADASISKRYLLMGAFSTHPFSFVRKTW